MKKKLLLIIFCVGFLASSNILAVDIFGAIRTNNIEMVKLFLENGAKETINRANKDGETPLYWACRRNNLEMVELLLPHCTKETINRANKDGTTPLYGACLNNNLEMVKLLLLANGAKETINRANKGGKTPLSWACLNNNLEMFKLLLPHCTKETINREGKYGYTPLSWACYKNNIEMVKLLLRYGATIRQKDIDKTSDQEIKKYLTLVEQLDEAINKIEFIENKKDNKYLKDILKLSFFRSVQDILENSKKYKTTLFFELCEKTKFGKYKWLKKAMRNSLQIKDVNFESVLKKTLDKNPDEWTEKEKKTIKSLLGSIEIRKKDFHERVDYVLNKI